MSSKKVSLRIDSNLYDFLSFFAETNNQTVSDVIRDVLKYFYMRLLLGHFRDKNYEMVRREFLNSMEKIPKIYKQEFFFDVINKKTYKQKK